MTGLHAKEVEREEKEKSALDSTRTRAHLSFTDSLLVHANDAPTASEPIVPTSIVDSSYSNLP